VSEYGLIFFSAVLRESRGERQDDGYLMMSLRRAAEFDSLIDVQQRFGTEPGRNAAKQFEIGYVAEQAKHFANHGTLQTTADQTVLKNSGRDRAFRNFTEKAFIVFDGHLNGCHRS
jgi:hypothetical protein